MQQLLVLILKIDNRDNFDSSVKLLAIGITGGDKSSYPLATFLHLIISLLK